MVNDMKSSPNYEKEIAVWVAIGMVLCGGSLLIAGCQRESPISLKPQESMIEKSPLAPPDAVDCPPRRRYT